MNALYPEVAARAQNRCEYCHAPEEVFNFPFEVEHVHPRMRGETDDLDNLALLMNRPQQIRARLHWILLGLYP
ncbi:MAG: hypothetical protein OHK0029_02150 [Armatimonadaceae bacterium]